MFYTTINMLEIFQYSFVVRGLEAGLIIGMIAPVVGMFLVLRRYSLIADTLSHVSLAGVAIGLLTGLNPLLTAIGASALSSLAIEKLRNSRKIYGETALSIFLSGSLAIAIVLIGLSNGFNVGLFSYLFGSILTVKTSDIYIMASLAAVVMILFAIYFRELIYLSFDEDSARVSGIPARTLNFGFMLVAATTIAISIPIVGILLISALIVLPVISALQLRQSFAFTLLYAEMISIFSIIAGVVGSFYLDVPAGGFIVIIMLAVFLTIFAFRRPLARLSSR